MRAAALVVFPGGFGTFDELFEMTTLVETGKMKKVPIVCVDPDYWSKVVNVPMLVEEGMISESEAGILTYAEDADHAWQMLVDAGLTIPPARGPTPRKDVAP
jgi:predicted Rossmann-fold nucleotide-binding protein